ncbi:hypothetical protein FG446_003740 [Yersinia enterocolitica]|nr:hypothetical protein [Yersinia enterocolitica]
MYMETALSMPDEIATNVFNIDPLVLKALRNAQTLDKLTDINQLLVRMDNG